MSTANQDLKKKLNAVARPYGRTAKSWRFVQDSIAMPKLYYCAACNVARNYTHFIACDNDKCQRLICNVCAAKTNSTTCKACAPAPAEPVEVKNDDDGKDVCEEHVIARRFNVPRHVLAKWIAMSVDIQFARGRAAIQRLLSESDDAAVAELRSRVHDAGAFAKAQDLPPAIVYAYVTTNIPEYKSIGDVIGPQPIAWIDDFISRALAVKKQ
jgi:hypothetical protein